MPKQRLKPNPRYLDLACGQNCQPGFTGVDHTTHGTQAHIAHDLLTVPWPFQDASIEQIRISHFLEHIPHGDGYHDPFFQFFDEIYRILRPTGTVQCISPYYTSVRAIQDPTHLRSIGEPTYCYLSQAWRQANRLTHYPVACNFEVVKVDYVTGTECIGRAQEAVQYAVMHYWNVVQDMVVVLKKAPRGTP